MQFSNKDRTIELSDNDNIAIVYEKNKTKKLLRGNIRIIIQLHKIIFDGLYNRTGLMDSDDYIYNIYVTLESEEHSFLNGKYMIQGVWDMGQLQRIVDIHDESKSSNLEFDAPVFVKRRQKEQKNYFDYTSAECVIFSQARLWVMKQVDTNQTNLLENKFLHESRGRHYIKQGNSRIYSNEANYLTKARKLYEQIQKQVFKKNKYVINFIIILLIKNVALKTMTIFIDTPILSYSANVIFYLGLFYMYMWDIKAMKEKYFQYLFITHKEIKKYCCYSLCYVVSFVLVDMIVFQVGVSISIMLIISLIVLEIAFLWFMHKKVHFKSCLSEVDLIIDVQKKQVFDASIQQFYIVLMIFYSFVLPFFFLKY